MLLFLTLLVSAALLQLFLPWWIVAPLACILAYYFHYPPIKSFLLCFLAIYCLDSGYSLYISISNHHIMANRISGLLGIPDSSHNWIWMVLITGLPAALVAGFSGLAGHYIKKSF